MNKIQLSEEKLHYLIRESINEVLNEDEMEEGFGGRLWGGIKGVGNAVRGEFNKAKQGVMQTGLGNEYSGQNFGSRMKAAKNMIKAQANQGDVAQELNNLKDTLYKMELNKYFNKATQPLVDQLYKALDAQIQSGENLAVKGAYKKGYGQKMPQKQYSDVRSGGSGGRRPEYITGGLGTGTY
jgi:hypothetical protein